jgi:hypothetical protein
MSVAEIIHSAKRLEEKSFEKLYQTLTALRVQRHGIPILDKTESNLLAKINSEFDDQKRERLQYLDWKIEFGALNELEEVESLRLAEEYETFGVERLKALSQLALLRQVSLDDLMNQLGINP